MKVFVLENNTRDNDIFENVTKQDCDILNKCFYSENDIREYLNDYEKNQQTKIINILIDDVYVSFSVWSHSQEKWLHYCFYLSQKEVYKKTSHDVKYISIYATTIHFGGYEEGGWFYRWYQWLESHNVENLTFEELEELKNNLIIKYEDSEEGDISSVLGEIELTIFEEDYPMQYETKCKPKYE